MLKVFGFHAKIRSNRLFLEQIKKLEAEKKRIQDEFNVQRAKMKELFLQKEGKLNKTLLCKMYWAAGTVLSEF